MHLSMLSPGGQGVEIFEQPCLPDGDNFDVARSPRGVDRAAERIRGACGKSSLWGPMTFLS
jgi:hypothetical protein